MLSTRNEKIENYIIFEILKNVKNQKGRKVKKLHLDRILKIRLPITVAVILLTFTVTFFATKAGRDGVGYEPEQPIKFSHAIHAGKLNIDCQYCHTGVEKTRHAGIPSPSICMNCHSFAKRESPEVQKLIQHFFDKKPIHWKRIHKVPDYAFFNHSVHVKKGINCVHCHGDVANMDVISQKQSFRMGQCLSCHRNPRDRMPELAKEIQKGPENCNSCHR